MMRLVRGARQFATSSRLERRVVLHALWMTPRIRRSLNGSGYAATRAWLQDRPPPDFGSNVSDGPLVKADKAIRRLPWNVKCLERSLAIWWIAGEGSVIRLGVAPSRQGQGHRFHAWVERDGRVLNDSPDVASEYIPLVGHAVEAADTRLFD